MQPTIALLSNINIDPLKSNFQQLGIGEVYVAGYNQWQHELLNSDSWVRVNQPDYVLVYLHPDAGGYDDTIHIAAVLQQYLHHCQRGTLLICELAGLPLSVGSYHDNQHAKETQHNQQFYALAQNDQRVKIVPMRALVALHGYTSLFDNKYWYLGRMKLSLQGYKVLAREVQLLIRAIEGKSRKVLVVDLDNTLWGGIVGEDGWQNLSLSNEGKGLIYKEFQQLIADLQKTGILLASCSKNNEADAKEAFLLNTNMVLQWDDFITHRINWNNKDENLRSIAQELNLGIDSLVFIDDSPVERELVLHSIPEMAAPHFPDDITTLPFWFLDEVVYPYFSRINYTQEDAGKTNQYRRNASREEEKQHLSFEDFITQLNIELQVEDLNDSTIERVAQLTQKTNQFNLTGRRYSAEAISQLLRQGNWKAYTCNYSDKFGDEGIVGAMLVEFDDKQARIDNFLLSCRALGRKVEFRIVENILRQLQHSGITEVRAEYLPSDRNQQASDFYTRAGFTETETNQYQIIL